MHSKPNVVAIVQARMGSTRLPGKVLADIGGRPMLDHVVNRVRYATKVDQLVVATSREAADDAIAGFCESRIIPCFRGSQADVLDRYYQAAREYRADPIVRVTADCPLLDPEVIDRVIATFLAGEYDYVTNTLRYTYPDGLDVEVFRFGALERAWREAELPAAREHVTPYLRSAGRFRVGGVEHEPDLSGPGLRWTVDEPADLEFVRAVYSRLGTSERPFGMREVLALLESHPELAKWQSEAVRNEGYYTSLAHEPPLPEHSRVLRRSSELATRAEKLIPAGSQTFSKGPTQFVQGVAPRYLVRGEGSRVWDVDGNEYLDYPMGLGAIILGHCYPAVNEAVVAQIRAGTTFSLPHPLEMEVAEKLVEMIPCAEMVRFGKNGSDATSAAVRVARAFTGRDVIACCGYHGWHDWYIGTTTRNLGVPPATRALTVPFEYNDLASLEAILAAHPGQVAAVVMEPVGVVEPFPDFLQGVKALAHREGALLIFDEVITGFRLALGGAQEYFCVTPDLACVGKAMANGYPISAVVGRRDVMELFDEVFFSLTFGGETLSLAAALSTVTEMQAKNVIGQIWERGQQLKDGYNALARFFEVERFTQCIGLGPRTVMTFQDETGAESLVQKSLVQQECLKRGVLFTASNNVSYSHSLVDVDHTLRVYRAAMEVLAGAIQSEDVERYLEGPPVQPVFRRA